jgi:hypothetical protein
MEIGANREKSTAYQECSGWHEACKYGLATFNQWRYA